MGKGVAQEYSLLSEEDKWKLRLRSHVLIDIDEVKDSNLATIMQGKAPLAVYVPEAREQYQSFLKQLVSGKDAVLLWGGNSLKNLDFSIDSVSVVPIDLVDALPWNGKAKEVDSLQFTVSKELSLVVLKNEHPMKDSLLLQLWRAMGRVPNFLQVDPSKFLGADSLVQELNKVKRVFGTVNSKTGPLKDVGFKNHKNLRVNAYFSLPMEAVDDLPVFIPYKAGYYFSPDIIRTTADNSGNLKEFVGFPLDPEYGLTDHFSFSPTIRNISRKNNKELIVNKVQLEEDRNRATVGYFNDGAYVDAGLDSRMALQGSFTIAAWIKPTVLSNNNSILGKGENFVLKLHKGFLTFTMADIKDYISRSSPVPVDQWTHVALVHSKWNHELSFFINGVQTDKIQLIEDYDTSDYNLVVGSNLWQEFFIGYLDDIKIWDRELNPSEIKEEFKGDSIAKAKGLSGFLIPLIVIGLLLLVFSLYSYRRRKRTIGKAGEPVATSIVTARQVNPNVEQERATFVESIHCFGPLKIILGDGADIAKKLSPKLKQLFLVVLLYSMGDRKGISTKKLTEYLWPGMSPSRAKNTRGTNIQNLRAILAASTTIQLVFKDRHWVLEIGDDCFCEYREVLYYLDFFLKTDIGVMQLEKTLPKLLTILKEERFLANIEDAWLDPFVEELSNRVLEVCQVVVSRLSLEEHQVLLQDLAQVMYIYDDLNENALQLKLKILILQGKLSTAHSVYDKFSKLYQKLYGETYPVKFEEIVGNSMV